MQNRQIKGFLNTGALTHWIVTQYWWGETVLLRRFQWSVKAVLCGVEPSCVYHFVGEGCVYVCVMRGSIGRNWSDFFCGRLGKLNGALEGQLNDESMRCTWMAELMEWDTQKIISFSHRHIQSKVPRDSFWPLSLCMFNGTGWYVRERTELASRREQCMVMFVHHHQ